MIEDKIKIILVENNVSDIVLIERQVKKAIRYPEILNVDTFQKLKDAIDTFVPDVVLCDYQLNGFNGFEVLTYIKSLDQYIPFIFITGTINDEELAASTIISGATGYILKKNINSLHKKLLPYFEKIIQDKLVEPLSAEHKKIFVEMHNFLETVETEKQMDRASFLATKNYIEKIKALKNRHK